MSFLSTFFMVQCNSFRLYVWGDETRSRYVRYVPVLKAVVPAHITSRHGFYIGYLLTLYACTNVLLALQDFRPLFNSPCMLSVLFLLFFLTVASGTRCHQIYYKNCQICRHLRIGLNWVKLLFLITQISTSKPFAET